ncbi:MULTISPECIES: hypothetical protein [unclassified Clostridium]|uniref:hypothetical protein n=1 Tax=unclassified Clostridium TaxID=2614128 RepID=UPI0025C5DE97|nr:MULTISPECIES: hypothetical protein [unclassified Clostridium]
MANYFRCDTSFMKNTNAGGRLYSAQYGEIIPNGFIGFMGSFISGSKEVRTLLAPTAELIKAGTPVIVMKPEINYKEDKKTDYALGIFRNPGNKPVPAIPFSEFDGVDLSEDYFDLAGKTGDNSAKIEVNDLFTLQANGIAGTQLKYAASAPAKTSAHFYFKVVGVSNSHTAVYVHSDGNRFPKPYKMIALEIIFQ